MGEAEQTADSRVVAYRPDIDGLRAVAVVAVIFYHLATHVFPTGYLGVDIFFVISGYLIGRILWREVGVGSFSLRRFYERRIRRIMPALLVVLIAAIAGSACLLLPTDLIRLGRSALATLAFAANIYFSGQIGYAAPHSSRFPLLHLWSLGVEEQFYLLFPLLLLLCARLARRWTPVVLGVLLVVSLGCDILLLQASGEGVVSRLLSEVVTRPCEARRCANAAFYLLPPRAWEFAGGALLVFFDPRLSRPWAYIVGLAGAALVAAALLVGERVAPGVLTPAMPAVIGTALLIWSGAARTGPAYAALACKPAVAIGLISYSLYLWHWPILVLTRYWSGGVIGWSAALAVLAATFAASFLSWRYVERPFRSRAMPVRRVLAWVGGGLALVLAAALALIAGDGFPQRLNPAAARFSTAIDNIYECPRSGQISLGAASGCTMNLPSHNPADADVILLGNSHARMYAPMVADILVARHLRGLLVTENRCAPSVAINFGRRCLRVAGDEIAAAQRLPARIVIVALNWENDDAMTDVSGRRFAGGDVTPLTLGLADTIALLQRAGKTVVLVGPIARPHWPVTWFKVRSLLFGAPMPRLPYRDRAGFDREMQPAFAAFGGRSDIIFMRPDLDQCAGDRCNLLRGDQALFADDSHLARNALGLFRARFDSAIEAAQRRAAGVVSAGP